MLSSFQIHGATPLEKFLLKLNSSLALAIGPSALKKVGGMSAGPAEPLLCMACVTALSFNS